MFRAGHWDAFCYVAASSFRLTWGALVQGAQLALALQNRRVPAADAVRVVVVVVVIVAPVLYSCCWGSAAVLAFPEPQQRQLAQRDPEGTGVVFLLVGRHKETLASEAGQIPAVAPIFLHDPC